MDEFDRYRSEMYEKLLGSNHLEIKRFTDNFGFASEVELQDASCCFVCFV